MSTGRGYGLRAMISSGDQYNALQKPLNLTNKQSSFCRKNANASATKNSSPSYNNSPAQQSTLLSSNSAESLSPRQCSPDDEIHEGFGGDHTEEKQSTFMEGVCYLKTKTDRFKDHWAVLNGNEIFCYRSAQDTKSRVMHCLAGTFAKENPEEVCPDTGKTLYPVKIVLPPNKSRILYFESKQVQKEWMQVLMQAMGYTNIFDFYELGKNLGKGQFGLVKLATHNVTGALAAVKTVKKTNMKPIEVF